MKRQVRYRIKSKIRFITFLATMIVLMLSGYMGLSGTINADGNSINSVETVCVSGGDSLWSIAEAYAPENTDIRQFVHKIEKYNGIKPESLKVGDELKIPLN